MLLILVTFALLILLYFAFVKPFNYWKDRGVPQYHYSLAICNLLRGLVPFNESSDAIFQFYKDFPDARYCGIYQFYTPTLTLRDPDLIKQITIKDFDHFQDRHQFLPEGIDTMWDKNLITLRGDRWRRIRSILTPAFTSSKLKDIFNSIKECSKDFVLYFEEQKSDTIAIEAKHTFIGYVSDTMAKFVFGINGNSIRDPNSEFYLMGIELTRSGAILSKLKFITFILLPKFAKVLGLTLFSKRVMAFFMRVVKGNIDSREKNRIVRPDMMNLLMDAKIGRYETSRSANDAKNTELRDRMIKLTQEDITAQVLAIFFGGVDGVSTALSFMAHELAVCEDVQKRLQIEIDEIMDKCNGNLTFDDLPKMKYMDMVVSEVLRKWPGGSSFVRVCTKPYVIPPVKEGERPVHLRKGDFIVIPTFGLHRDPEIFPNPEQFDPERFNEENKSRLPPHTYAPFGLGPRNCIGLRLAFVQIKVVFFYLLSKFNLTVIANTAVPLQVNKAQIQLSVKDGIWVGLKSRN